MLLKLKLVTPIEYVMEVTTKRWKEWSMCRLYLVEWHQMTSKSNTTRPQHRSQQHTSFAWYTPGWKFYVLWSCRQYQRWFFIKTTSSEIGLPFYPRKKKINVKDHVPCLHPHQDGLCSSSSEALAVIDENDSYGKLSKLCTLPSHS